METSTQQNKGKVTILLAHPNMGESKANRALTDAVKDLPGVIIKDLYADPFNVESYKQVVTESSLVVFQFPFYWASAPSQLKKWCDEIFMALVEDIKGIQLMVAVTAGSDYDAYRSGGRNQYTMDELLRPYQLIANHSGMVWQTPFVVYSTVLPDAPEKIEAGAKVYRERIGSYL